MGDELPQYTLKDVKLLKIADQFFWRGFWSSNLTAGKYLSRDILQISKFTI